MLGSDVSKVSFGMWVWWTVNEGPEGTEGERSITSPLDTDGMYEGTITSELREKPCPPIESVSSLEDDDAPTSDGIMSAGASSTGIDELLEFIWTRPLLAALPQVERDFSTGTLSKESVVSMGSNMSEFEDWLALILIVVEESDGVAGIELMFNTGSPLLFD